MNRSISAIFTSCRAGGRWGQSTYAAPAALILFTALGASTVFGAEIAIDRVAFGSVSWSDGTYSATAQPLIVTSSDPPTGGDRLATPGVPVGGVNVDGVGQLLVDVHPDENLIGVCTACLVGDGSQILTAAHCVTAPDGSPNVIDGVDGNGVVFNTIGGPVVVPFDAADVTRHPSYDGDFLHGFDVAVIDLGAPVDSSIPRYMLNTDSGGFFEASPHLAAGYGESGDGATGVTIPISLNTNTKRTGENRFESTGLGIFGVGGITNNETQLTADFDSGLAANDAFDFFFSLGADLGLGADEVGTAPGDSGGPTFILDGLVPKIVGIHSYGIRLAFLSDGSSSDVDGIVNSSFGEFLVDARLAEPAVLAWLQQVIVPEPSSLWLLLVGLICWAGRSRR